MPAVSQQQLIDAGRDARTIADIANSTADTTIDRPGRTRRTLTGVINWAISQAQIVLGGLGYLPPVAYASGINITNTRQTVTRNGVTYAANADAVPFTTSGTFETAKFRVVQGVTSVDLAVAGAAAGIGFAAEGAGAVTGNMQDEIRKRPDILQYGALSGSGNNDAPAINSAITQADTRAAGVALVPVGVFRTVNAPIVIDGTGGLVGAHRTRSVLVLDNTGTDPNDGSWDVGIDVGTSAADGSELARLNIRGGKKLAMVRIRSTSLVRPQDLTFQSQTNGHCMLFDASQDIDIDRVEVIASGNATAAAVDLAGRASQAHLRYKPGTNNVRHHVAHFEQPHVPCAWVEQASAIQLLGGKADGGPDASQVTPYAFFTCDAGELIFRNYEIFGFKAPPLEGRRWGTIDYEGVMGDGNASSFAQYVGAAYRLAVLDGFSPGVIFRPYISLRGEVRPQSVNTTNQVLALIDAPAPDPRMKPNAGNDGRIVIASAFDTGSGQWQASMTEWNGTAFAAPTTNDRYVGGYIVDKLTGVAVGQIEQQTGSLIRYRPLNLSSPNANGDRFATFDEVTGVRFTVDLVVKSYKTARALRVVKFVQIVTVTGRAYDDPLGQTLVQLSAAVANDTLIGMFLRDPVNDAYYWILSNSGAQLRVLHKRDLVLPNGVYEIVAGNPKAGVVSLRFI